MFEFNPKGSDSMAHFDLPENRKFRICQFTDIHLEADERFALADKT